MPSTDLPAPDLAGAELKPGPEARPAALGTDAGAAPEPWSAPAPRLDEAERRLLLDLAWASIRHGLATGAPLAPDTSHTPARLAAPGAAFVTLERGGRLRGCIGHVSAVQPLIRDVAENAFAAAFRDPRFPPLEPWELPGIDLDISVLSPPEPLPVRSEAELLACLRPGVDGVILEDRGARGTFLPSVWETLPEPRRFLEELRRKAGLPPGWWGPSLKVSRYVTECFGEPCPAQAPPGSAEDGADSGSPGA